MLWPLVLPFKITCVVMIVLVAAVTLAAPLVRWKRWNMLGLSVVLAAMAFIPSCAGIMTVIDTQRFGVFHHATFDEVNDPRVEPWFPTAATDIRLHKSMQGFQAKYSIAEADLKKFMDGIWSRYGQYSTMSRTQIQTQLDAGRLAVTSPADLNEGSPDWPPLTNPVVYMSPRAANGAGFTIWYSVEDGVAYQEAGYW